MYLRLTSVFAAMVHLFGSILAVPITLVHPDDLANSPTDPSSTLEQDIGVRILAALNGFGTQHLELDFVNSLPDAVNSYVIGKDSKNNPLYLQTDGTYSTTFSSNNALKLGAQGASLQIQLPDYLNSGRIYFATGDLHFSGGTQPSFVNPNDADAAVHWGFVEFTSNADGVYANLSFVDFVGLPLGMSIQKEDGSIETVKGARADAVASVCSAMKAQTAKDGRPWSDLCQADASGNVFRVVAPIHHLTGFETYWNDYVDRVWTHYASNTLTIDTQSPIGKVSCGISGGRLTCDHDEASYGKPTASDIFGCDSGVFGTSPRESESHKAIKARICAAFNRGTLLIDGGNVQPGVDAGEYYGQEVGNFYARAVHAAEIDGRGYAFAYDDVNPGGGVEQSGTLVDTTGPKKLTVVFGGWTG